MVGGGGRTRKRKNLIALTFSRLTILTFNCLTVSRISDSFSSLFYTAKDSGSLARQKKEKINREKTGWGSQNSVGSGEISAPSTSSRRACIIQSGARTAERSARRTSSKTAKSSGGKAGAKRRARAASARSKKRSSKSVGTRPKRAVFLSKARGKRQRGIMESKG